jgi:valyl-tRNA synthetase
MSPELSSRYDPKEVEARVYAAWLAHGHFHAEPSGPGKKSYCIVIPPPNVTGALHLGHALNNTLQDVLTRFHRMKGDNTLWMPGTDHAATATQAVVERKIFQEEGKTRHDLGRDELVRRIDEWRQLYGNRILEQLAHMGCSCDWARTRFTLDEVCARAVRQVFLRLFEAGLIYRGKRLVNWDPVSQTALSDDELEHETVKTKFWNIRYPLSDGSGFVVVATTRPETMLGDTAVAIHPKDPRAASLVGKKTVLPLMNREIPIIADDYVSLPGEGDKAAFSTGFLKVTPAHDPNDYEIGQRHGLPMINIFNRDATVNENGGKYAGLDRFKARKAVVADLEALGLIESEKPYEHEVAHSERSKAPIEPLLSDQWYVRSDTLAKLAADAVRDGRVKFTPARYADTYLTWLDHLRDWCISRQLWYGHRIPVWYCANRACYDPKQYESCEAGSSEEERAGRRFFFSPLENPKTCPKCGSADIVQDEDVLDTWFSSALWPFSTLGWPEETAELKFYYPTNVLVTNRDIITLWVARMVMMGLFNIGEVPFRDVYIHATILDGKGERMSKSKGNGVDPIEIIEEYGADALRFSVTHMTGETQDIRMPVERKRLADGREANTSKKFELGRNFTNKLWNASRFVLGSLEGWDRTAPAAAGRFDFDDRWILSRLALAAREATAELEQYAFGASVQRLYGFFWNELCDWYLERAKAKLAAGGEAKKTTQRVLAFTLDQTLRLLHPVIPFVTEAVWEMLEATAPGRDLTPRIHAPASEYLVVAAWPEGLDTLRDAELDAEMELLQGIVHAIREIRGQMEIAPKQGIKAVLSAGKHAGFIRSHSEFITSLAQVDQVTVETRAGRPAHSASAVVSGVEIFVPLEGLIDFEKERARLTQRIEKAEKGLQSVSEKLANTNFVERARPEVIEQERGREQELRGEVEKLKSALRGLEA